MARTIHKEVRDEMKLWNTSVHPELKKALQRSAIDNDQSDYERLHEILCYEFGRQDLLAQAPDPVADPEPALATA